ncbi:MAG: hypothetical protein ACC645_23585, partial [Pirellulales bacterium]
LLWWPSSSSHIIDEKTGENSGLRGQRLYLIARDASDIPRAGKVLFGRLWLAGFGHVMISSAGQSLPRSPVDGSVWQPSRVDYAAGAFCDEGFRQERGAPEILGGEGDEEVDTRLVFPDLTAEERLHLNELQKAAKEAVADKARATKEPWIIKHLVDKAVAELGSEATDSAIKTRVAELASGSAGKRLERVASGDGGVLPLSFVLHRSMTDKVTVGDVLHDTKKYDRMGICDPVEPTYNGWHRGATIFGNNRRLVSHIHGTKTKYILGTDEEYAALRRELVVELNKRLDELSTGWAAEKNVLTDEAVALYVGAEEESETRVEIEGIARKNRQLTKFRQLVRDAQALGDAEKRDEARYSAKATQKANSIRTDGRITVECSDQRIAMDMVPQISEEMGKSQILFTYGGSLAEVAVRDTSLGEATERDDKGNRIAGAARTIASAQPIQVSRDGLPFLLTERHEFVRMTTNGILKSCYPPPQLVSAVLAHGHKHVPELSGVMTYPVWWRGELLQGSGFHEPTGLWLNTGSVNVDPDQFRSAKEAYRWLRENLLADFPFASEEDAVKLLAMALSMMVAPETLREPGPPLFVISANRQNMGKTLAAEIMTSVVSGRPVTMVPWVSDREEMTKVLATLVKEAAPVQIFDNMPRGWRVKSAQLDGYVTAVNHGGRLLGSSQTIEGPANAVVCITGNRLHVAGDTRSRALKIEFFLDTDQNQTDRDFLHPNLPEYVRRNRPKILSALARILQEGAAKPWTRDQLPMRCRFPAWAQAVAWTLWLASGVDIT